MIIVEDIIDDVSEALGNSGDSRPLIFRRLNLAVEMLSAKGDWDPLLDVVDVHIPEGSSSFALPAFVHTVLGVSTDGVPVVGRDRFFEFHQNGPGRFEPGTGYRDWREQGLFSTQYPVSAPGRLIAQAEHPNDVNGYSSFTVHGFDVQGLRLTELDENGNVRNGIRIPIVQGYVPANLSLPEVSRITSIRKPITQGRVRLYVDRGSDTASELLGTYEFQDQSPEFLRIDLGKPALAVRVFFRHKSAKVVDDSGVIRLHNVMALLNAVKAVRYYLQDDPEQGAAYEAVATRMLQEQEAVRQPPNHTPIQVAGVVGSSDTLD